MSAQGSDAASRSYRKRPVEVEAVRWDGQNYAEVKAFVGLESEIPHG